MATEQVCNLAGTACGTGGWAGPLPGDPDNNVILRASTSFGGVSVNWTYPTTNSHAVAHTLLYRATEGSFEQSMQIAVVAGNAHYDQLNPRIPTEYFYWIQLVSVNGTVGDLIGPAMGLAVPIKTSVKTEIEGSIDDGVLAQALKTQIDKITLNYLELTNEIANRIQGDDALSEALAAVQAGLDESLAFVHQEIQVRMDGDNALASQLNTVAALNQTNAAAILEERTARVTADSALATTVSSVNAATQGNAAAIQQETTARTTADTALASQINTVQSTLGGNISSVQTNMQTQINAVTGELDAIYTAKVDVNGLIGGFGIYGTATTVEAGFDVDRFWVGRTTNKLKPFVIDGSTVYMNNAVIKNASIDTLKIAGEAITVPRAYYGTSCWHDFQGGGGIIIFTCSAYLSGSGTGVILYVNGAQVHEQTISMQVLSGQEGGGYGVSGSFPCAVIHAQPGPMYSVSISAAGTSGGGWAQLSNPKFIVMSAKR